VSLPTEKDTHTMPMAKKQKTKDYADGVVANNGTPKLPSKGQRDGQKIVSWLDELQRKTLETGQREGKEAQHLQGPHGDGLPRGNYVHIPSSATAFATVGVKMSPSQHVDAADTTTDKMRQSQTQKTQSHIFDNQFQKKPPSEFSGTDPSVDLGGIANFHITNTTTLLERHQISSGDVVMPSSCIHQSESETKKVPTSTTEETTRIFPVKSNKKKSTPYKYKNAVFPPY
jgi:hypothetical protein